MPRPDGKARLYIPLAPEYDLRTSTQEKMPKRIQTVITAAFKPYSLKITKCERASTYKGASPYLSASTTARS